MACKDDGHESVHRDTIMKATNKMQLYMLIYYSNLALHVLGNVFAHHQEHLTVFTAYGSIHSSRCQLVSQMLLMMGENIVRNMWSRTGKSKLTYIVASCWLLS
jgi:hypothetical protein